MEISRRCDICNKDVLRASYAKRLRSKKHLENIRQDEIFIPEWFFKDEYKPIKNKMKIIYNPKPLKQIAEDNIKVDNIEIDKVLAKAMINPISFTDKNLEIGIKIIPDSHNINHANFILTNAPNFPKFGIRFRYIDKVLKDIAIIYARLLNRYKIGISHINFSKLLQD